MRPLKLRFVAEIPTSPGSSNPTPSPMHGPQPAGNGFAPASSRVRQIPVALPLPAPICSPLLDKTSLRARLSFLSELAPLLRDLRSANSRMKASKPSESRPSSFPFPQAIASPALYPVQLHAVLSH